MWTRSVFCLALAVLLLGSCSQVESPARNIASNPATTDNSNGNNGSPKDFSSEFQFSDVSLTDQFELGSGYDLSNKATKVSGLASFDKIGYSYNSIPSISGYVWNVKRQDIMPVLPTAYDENFDSFYETQFRHFGIDQKAKRFIDAIDISDRSITVFMYSTGQSSNSHLTTNETPNGVVSNALALGDLSLISGSYGDSYVREVTNGYIVFLITNVVVDPISQYEMNQVRDSFLRLEQARYTTSSSYGDADLDHDLEILQSKGVTIRTFAFSNLKIPGIDKVSNQKQFNDYMDLVRKSALDSVSSPIRIQLWSYKRLK